MVNKESVIPLYEQIKNEIIKNISAGIYETGSKIPSERELEITFDTSRITIRHAIEELVSENYLTKKQGKGTFVNAHKVNRNLLALNSYTDFMLENNSEPLRKVIAVNYEESNRKIAGKLELPYKSNVLKVERVMHFEKGNDGYEIGYYSTEQFPDLKSKITDDISISDILKKKYNVEDSRNHQQINLTFATKQMSERINVILGAPLFQIERTAYDINDKPIYFAIMYYNPNKISFTIDSKREK